MNIQIIKAKTIEELEEKIKLFSECKNRIVVDTQYSQNNEGVFASLVYQTRY